MKYCDNDPGHTVFMVEYEFGSPHHYDGVSEIRCSDCGRRTGRWCGNRLADDEVEPPHCNGGEHPKVI